MNKAMKKQKPKEPGRIVSLRINAHTTILIPEEKATPEYAEAYRTRCHLANQPEYTAKEAML